MGLKLAVLIVLLVLFGLLLGLGMALGYDFFTQWISSFKAFQQESEVKSSCTAFVVRHCSRASSPGSCTTQAGAVQVLWLFFMHAS